MTRIFPEEEIHLKIGMTAIGIGNFISTFVSVRLSRQWGLMPGTGTTHAEEPVRDLTSSN